MEVELTLSALTAVEKREAVIEYMDLPHGQKTKWLREQPFSRSSFIRWRLSYLAGDLDRGLTPRNAGLVTSSGHRMRQLEKAFAQQESEMAKLREQNEQLQATNAALGKAIGLMQKWSEHTPDNTPAPTDPGK